MSRKSLRILVNSVLAVAVIGAGVFVSRMLMSNKEEPQQKPPDAQGTLVEVMPVEEGTHQITVSGRGSVQPAREVQIKPQVGGKVVSMHPQLEKGGVIKEGEVLFQIEKADFQIAVANARTSVDQAEAQLALEQGRVEVAERELELFKDEKLGSIEDLDDESLRLARREPQVKSAEAQLKAAQNQLRKARLDLGRTTVTAPFDAIVREESLEVGDVVGAGAPVATLFGSRKIWVQVNLPAEDVTYLKIPGVNAKTGSLATVSQQDGEAEVTRTGRVLRLLGDLDPVGRLARVIVEVEDPFTHGPPLFLTSFVDVEIAGDRVIEGVEVPRLALRDGTTVWVMDGDDRLDIRPVEIGWRYDTSVVVTQGLQSGDRVVVSRLGAPVDGMALRVGDESPSPAETRAASSSEVENE